MLRRKEFYFFTEKKISSFRYCRKLKFIKYNFSVKLSIDFIFQLHFTNKIQNFNV